MTSRERPAGNATGEIKKGHTATSLRVATAIGDEGGAGEGARGGPRRERHRGDQEGPHRDLVAGRDGDRGRGGRAVGLACSLPPSGRCPSAHLEARAVAFVYLLRCSDDSLYCGWTTDVERR